MVKRFQKMKSEVVVMIIAILVAIGLPTFLGMRARAHDRVAQSDLRNGFTAVKAYYTDVGSYAGFNAIEGEGIEPALDWVDSDTPPVGQVGAAGITDTTVVLNRVSESGNAFCLADNLSMAGGIARGEGSAATYADCDALPNWTPGG
jgi:type IV pilus assembly protein PilA